MEIISLVSTLGVILTQKGFFVTTAESCTGGGIAHALTSVSGSSRWFERAFVTYSNQAKRDMLGVSAQTLKNFGAVSEETAKEMALGAIKNSQSQVSIAVSGIAGPEGGTPEKPVGLVCFAWCIEESVKTEQKIFSGNREEIRQQTIVHGILQLKELLGR